MTQPAATHAPGTPIWVDLSSPDVAATARFYSQLFGWRAEDLGPDAGNYHFFYNGDKVVAAAGPQQSPDQPPAWMTYVGTDDAEAIATKVTEAGGKVLVPPFAVMDQGSMGVFMDTTGGAFAVWQPAKMHGAEQFNTPVSMSWNELHSRDLEASKSFYPKVFGWTPHIHEMGEGMGQYIEWQVNGRSVAGGQGMTQEPAGVPTYWLVYFTVANTDDIVKRAPELGGKVMAPAMDIPQGRIAIIADPHGAAFGVISNPSQ